MKMSLRLSLIGTGIFSAALCLAMVSSKASEPFTFAASTPTPFEKIFNFDADTARTSNLIEGEGTPTLESAPLFTRSYHKVVETRAVQEGWGNPADIDLMDTKDILAELEVKTDRRNPVGYSATKALLERAGHNTPLPTVKKPRARSAHAVDIEAVRKRIARLMRKKDVVGLSIAVVEDGKLTFAEGFGETLKGSGERVTEDTIFRWASVSKGVAAATLMSLADDGHLELDNPVDDFKTTLALPKTQHDITVEDLLSHRVGIVRNAYDKRIEDGQATEAVREAIQYLRPVCEPGTCHSYQNVIYDSASEIAENITGLPYKAVVSERLFKPLDMNTATTTYEGLIRSKSWAKPHSRKGHPIKRIKPNYYRVPAAAGVNSSVVDLSKWMVAQMEGVETPLSEQARLEMQTPRVKTPRESRLMRRKYRSMKNSTYGLGWRIYDYNGHKVVGHRGGVEGYRALVLFDPEIKTGVAMMWNSSHSEPVGLQLEVMDQVYGNRTRDWMRLNRG